MALGRERYQTPNIFLCTEAYHPKGICYGKSCRPKKMTITEEVLSSTVKTYVNGVLKNSEETITGRQISIEPYLVPEGAEEYSMNVYLLAEGSKPECMLAYAPCTDLTGAETDISWQRDGDDIRAELPLPDHCGVEKFLTTFPEGTLRYETPGHIGEADGENVILTFDAGGYVRHKAPLDDTLLIPGQTVSISYKLRGFAAYYPFALYRYETEMLTTVTVRGCGLVKKVKVYRNPAKPDEGYTYEYAAYEGGEGYTISTEWLYETTLRYLAEYLGELYWIKPSDTYPYAVGETAALVKDVSEAEASHNINVTSDVLAEEIDEDKALIIPLRFY